MRARTLVISIAAHAVVIVAISQCDFTFERAPSTPAPRVELVPHEDEPVPIDIVFEPEAGGEPAAAAALPTHVGRAPAPAIVAVASTANVGIEVPQPEPARPNPLAMRGLRHDLSLPKGMVDGILGAAPPAETPGVEADPRWAPDPKLGKLQPTGGGKQIINDKVATWKVAPDGTIASVKDKPYFTIHFNFPNPWMIVKALREAETSFEDWRKNPYRDAQVGKIQDLPRHITAIPGACDSYVDLWCSAELAAGDSDREDNPDDTDDDGESGGLGISGKADITGYLHKKFIGDPYASRKLKILDTTRDERVRVGTQFRAQQLARSAEYVQRNLQTLWRTVSDPAQRRAGLFTLWDECTEDVDGNRARMMVIGWIRTHLPDGSAGAYTTTELAQLATRKTSKQPFAPY